MPSRPFYVENVDDNDYIIVLFRLHVPIISASN